FPKISDNTKNLIDDKYKNIYDKIVDELTILGYYLGLRSEIVKISDALILDKKCTINKNQVISNQRFYLEPLKIIKNIVLPLKLDQGWFAMNPSILKITDGYLINCRLVNYNITHEGLYIIY